MMQYQRGPAYATGIGGANDITSACYAHATDLADVEQTPVAIWHRDGWHVVSDVAPDIDEDDTREMDGWQIVAMLAPEEDTPVADYIVSYRYDIDDWAPCVREDLDGLDALSLRAVFSSEAEARAFISTMCGLMHMGGNPEDFRIERRN